MSLLQNVKLKNIDKLFEILFVISVFIFIGTVVVLQPLNDLDEIWNYNFSKNIIEGKLPYKDFNIITMPLVPYIGAVFLATFGNEMFSMRIFAIITNFIILVLFYQILKELKIEKNLSRIFTIGLIYLLKPHFRIDYNFYTLMILLTIILVELKNIDKLRIVNRKIDILLGILAGLTICSKQTVGICISIVTVFYQIMFVKDKVSFKVFLKKAGRILIGVISVIGLLCVFFTIFNLWVDFVDYAILGIKGFSNKISYFSLLKSKKWYIVLLSIIVPCYLIINLAYILIKKLKIKKELDINNIILLAYSWASFAVVYPISDEIHFIVGAVPAIIGIIYVSCYKLIGNKKRLIFIETTGQVLVLALFAYSIINANSFWQYYKKIDRNKELNHFNDIPTTSSENVMEVDEYIKSQKKNVYILDASAALYTIPIDQYTKDFDMFNKGNLGAKGENGIIQEINEMKDCQFLILQDNYRLNWQAPINVIQYIKSNFNKVGSIGVFDVYE